MTTPLHRPPPAPVPSRAPQHDAPSPDAPRLTLLADADACVARIRAGDAQAFDALFNAYWEPLCEFAYVYVRSVSAAEDAVADVFATLWQRRAELTIQTTIDVYLYSAVRYRATRIRHTAARRAFWNAALAHDAAPPGGHVQPPPADVVLEARERLEAVDRAVAALPERYRSLLVLRWQQHLSWKDVARVLGVSSAAAMMQHTRALKALRDTLPKEYIG